MLRTPSVVEGSSSSSDKKRHEKLRAKMEAFRRKENTDELFSMHIKMYERHRLAQSKVCIGLWYTLSAYRCISPLLCRVENVG